MPTYEYCCPRCGMIEVSHAITRPPLSKCPLCDLRVVRLISGGAAVLTEPRGYWELDANGRERKVDRTERETQWRAIVERNRLPI